MTTEYNPDTPVEELQVGDRFKTRTQFYGEPEVFTVASVKDIGLWTSVVTKTGHRFSFKTGTRVEKRED